MLIEAPHHAADEACERRTMGDPENHRVMRFQARHCSAAGW